MLLLWHGCYHHLLRRLLSSPDKASSVSLASLKPGLSPVHVPVQINNFDIEGLPYDGHKPSPYLSVRVGCNMRTTRTHQGTVTPHWGETFHFAMGAADTLYFTVWDDTTSENLGEVWLTAKV